jgi:penicillin-binding protein 1A
MPKPDNVVEVGSELYFDEFTPGHGFIATVGISQAALDAANGASEAPAQVDEQEKQNIMNLFRGH